MSVSILHGPCLSLYGTKLKCWCLSSRDIVEPREAKMPVPIFRSSSVFFRSLKLLVVSLVIESSGCFTVL